MKVYLINNNSYVKADNENEAMCKYMQLENTEIRDIFYLGSIIYCDEYKTRISRL